MSTQQIFEALLSNLMNSIGEIKAAAIVDRNGLIIHSKLRVENAGDDIIGTVTAVFDSFIARVKADFGSAENFLNVMSVDQNKFVFAGAGSQAILTVISSLDADDTRLKVYSEFIAEKVEFLLDGEEITTEIPPIVEVFANMRSGKLPKGEYSMKVIVMGDPMVGKTSLIKRFVDGKFKDSYISTIGVDISRKDVKLSEELDVSMTIWDIGGQIKTMAPYRKRFYQGVNFAFLEFDVSRKKTFDSLKGWREDLKKGIYNKVPVILIANKMDLPDHEVSMDEIKAYAEELNCPYLLCSAKTGSNVNDAFRYASLKFCENV